MLRRVFYAIAAAYVFVASIGLLKVYSDRFAGGGRQHSRAELDEGGFWPLSRAPGAAKPAVPVQDTRFKTVQTNFAALHADDALIRPPAVPKVVQSNFAALHVDDALIKPPAVPKVVQSNFAALHADDALIKPPAVPKVVHSNAAAVHVGDTMIIPPPLSASDFAKPGLRPADASARSARSDPVPAPPVPRAKPRSTPSSWMANVSTGAVADEQDVPKARIVPRMAPPAWSKSKGAEQSPATAKGKPARPRNEAQQPRSTRPIGRKSNASAAARTETRALGNDVNEVRRAVEQLDDQDMRAFRLHCGQILSAPGRFDRSRVAICRAASL
jgi:hypothetical protein